MKEEISVLLSADDNYARYCAITMLSVLENSIAPSRFHFYILSPDCSDRSQNNIHKLCERFGAQASIISIDLNLFRFLPAIQKHFNLNNYSRLYGPNLCKDCQKMVYLDCDLIIRGDIAELFEYNLKGRPIGAVPHVQFPYEKTFRQEFNVNNQDTYFNSGVMLIDAVKWRKQQLGEAVLEVALESSHMLHFADQDALNAVFWEKYHHLPGIWNVEARLYREKLLGLTQTPEITERMANPKIIHYTGSDKPWSSQEYVPKRSLYTYYSYRLAELTGWFPSQPEPQRASIGSYLHFTYSCLYFRASVVKKQFNKYSMDSIKNQLRKNGITKKNAVKLLWRLQFPQSYWKNKDNIYLVYTMGKVGSTTIQETLEKTLKVADIFHIHTLSDQRLEKSRIHFPEAFRRAKKIKRKTKLKKRIKIITVTRDPIAKKISGLFQNPWLYGLNEEGITQLTPQELCNIIKNNLDKFYDALTWFDEEFFNFTGIDIYTEPFDFDLKKETISQNNIDVLALRLEDFKETEIITAHLSYFVGQPIQQLINRNQTQTKKFKELYKKTLDMIELPEDFIQEIYSSKYCTHFYTPTEIHQFRAKWTKSKN